MKIEAEIPQELLKAAVERAITDTFSSYSGRGVGLTTLRSQVDAWAAEQDYRPLIAEMAAGVVRETVRNTLLDAVRSAVKAEVKALKESGQLGLLVREAFVS